MAEVQSLDIGLAAPSRDAEHIAQPDRACVSIAWRDDSMPTSASRPRPCTCWSPSPCPSGRSGSAWTRRAASPEASAQLIDRLQQRLGAGAVCQLHPHQSHIPERAVQRSLRISLSPHRCLGSVSSAGRGACEQTRRHALPLTLTLSPCRKRHGEREIAPRPLLLLPRPEAAEVVALIPEARRGSSAGAACCIRWRRRRAPSASPRNGGAHGRGDARLLRRRGHGGRRFWLYRAGLYDRDEAPALVRARGVLDELLAHGHPGIARSETGAGCLRRWFLHGCIRMSELRG